MGKWQKKSLADRIALGYYAQDVSFQGQTELS